MSGSAADKLQAGGARRVRARLVYGCLLAAAVAALALHPELPALRAHPLALAALVALSLVNYAVSGTPLGRAGRIFDMNVALGLVALVVAGPLGLLVVSLAPDLVHLARRGGAFLGLGLVANLVSWLAEAVLAGALLGVLPSAGAGSAVVRGPLLLGVGIVMLAVNFGLARALLAVVRDRRPLARLVGDELLTALPFELLVLSAGVVCALWLPMVGVAAFAVFALLAWIPPVVADRLLHAPSVAALSVDEAAAVYRDALADELRLPRADRRLAHLVDALVQRRTLPQAPANPAAAIQDALLVTICTARPPTQRHFSASPRSQVVLVARRWAELTARCTPALNHPEALLQLRGSDLVRDAPLALTAAARIVAREHALTEHVAGVPRLHRAPLPRTLRHDVLPVALERLAA